MLLYFLLLACYMDVHLLFIMQLFGTKKVSIRAEDVFFMVSF
jgi:hypothetical protein